MSQSLLQQQSRMKLGKPRKGNENARAHSYWCVSVQKLDGTEKLCADFDHNVVPSVFIDKLHKMGFVDITAAERGFGAIALTADTTQTLTAAITALTGEITANGLARINAVTRTHTNGTNSTLIEHTFTLSGSQTDITRAALFNVNTAPVSGTIGPTDVFSNGATGAMVTGETVKVSITVTTS